MHLLYRLVKTFLFILIQSTVPVFLSAQVECDCTQFNKRDTLSDLIFWGKVEKITTNNISSGIKIAFRVDSVYQGKTDILCIIGAPYPKHACGFTFEEGDYYLVTAYLNRSFKTNSCLKTIKTTNPGKFVKLPAYLVKPNEQNKDLIKNDLILIFSVFAGLLLFVIVLLKNRGKRKA
jgi:hypothetical protein